MIGIWLPSETMYLAVVSNAGYPREILASKAGAQSSGVPGEANCMHMLRFKSSAGKRLKLFYFFIV